MKILVAISLVVTTITSIGAEVSSVSLVPAANMTRAELWYEKPTAPPRAVLVLCPGVNGSGEDLIRSPVWQDFARHNNLGLVGLSFASEIEAIHDGTGYYYASKGAGSKLLEGIKEIYGRDMPLLLYGFSGGAHFTSRFEEWKPESIIAWCAYSAMWWDTPQLREHSAPGIVACGDEDPRIGASLIYFKQGRALGKPWLWVCLPETAHTGSSRLDEFVRRYFSSVLNAQLRNEILVDIDQKIQIADPTGRELLTMTAVLPSSDLFTNWAALHQP